MARLGIQERDFLIATHERCESALASHANSLTTELDGAAQEVTMLFDRQATAVTACTYEQGKRSHNVQTCSTATETQPDALTGP